MLSLYETSHFEEALDALQLKRLIIANLADDDYHGHQAYWKSVAETK